MKILVTSNLREGKGLARDFEILRPILVHAGHVVEAVEFDDRQVARSGRRFDLVIVLEQCREEILGLAPRRWLVPNPEWWDPAAEVLLRRFERVLAKTQAAADAFRALGARVDLVGWESLDRYRADVPRARAVLFNPGGNGSRHDGRVLEVWRRGGRRLPLTVIGQYIRPDRINGVTFLGRVPDDVLAFEQNRHVFHLCPSSAEGWGHYLHEGLSAGAVIAATHAPPFDSQAGIAVQIPPVRVTRARLAARAEVDADEIARAVARFEVMGEAEITAAGVAARAAAAAERAAFRDRIRLLLLARAA